MFGNEHLSLSVAIAPSYKTYFKTLKFYTGDAVWMNAATAVVVGGLVVTQHRPVCVALQFLFSDTALRRAGRISDTNGFKGRPEVSHQEAGQFPEEVFPKLLAVTYLDIGEATWIIIL